MGSPPVGSRSAVGTDRVAPLQAVAAVEKAVPARYDDASRRCGAGRSEDDFAGVPAEYRRGYSDAVGRYSASPGRSRDSVAPGLSPRCVFCAMRGACAASPVEHSRQQDLWRARPAQSRPTDPAQGPGIAVSAGQSAAATDSALLWPGPAGLRVGGPNAAFTQPGPTGGARPRRFTRQWRGGQPGRRRRVRGAILRRSRRSPRWHP